MIRFFLILCTAFFCSISAQEKLPLDTLKLKEARDLYADDYGNVYIYKNKDFSLTKYDSLGKQLGKMMLTVPFRVQTVQNPLNIPLFSENAQELKFIDQNLNEIQKINFQQKFGFVRLVYAEDLQMLWILDESSKRLLQYNYRTDSILNSFPFTFNVDEVLDILIFENKVYLLGKNYFKVYNLRFDLLFESKVENVKRLRRENDSVLVIAQNSILQYVPNEGFKTIFEDADAKIVDKNSSTYFEIKDNNLYLYRPKND